MSTKQKKNILIIGPFGDFGGRELEASFLAGILEDEFKVSLLSTMIFTKKSQLFDFINTTELESLDALLYQKLHFKLFTFVSYVKNHRERSIKNYLHNGINKSLGLRKYSLKCLQSHIINNDIVVIFAQFSSNYIKEIIKYAYANGIRVIFRTTNFISIKPNIDLNWLENVDLFIHHSLANALRLNILNSHKFQLIDQCSFDESSYLRIPFKTEIKRFLSISRIVKEKNIDVLVEVFMLDENKDLELNIIGKGAALEELKQKASNSPNIKFKGYIPNRELNKYYKLNDCFIVSHFKYEAGPLTAIDAMAAGQVIVSAKTGAMPERLPNNDFFFENSVEDLNKIIKKIIKLNSDEIFQISNYNRNRYLEKYNATEIKSQYKNAIYSVLNQSLT